MKRASATDDLANEILKALRRILRKTAEFSRQLGRESGLTVPQVLCLAAIGKAPADAELTVARIADEIHLSVATASRLLDRLEESGLLMRERSQTDRRKVFVRLTTEGRRQLRRLPTPLQEQFRQRLDRLGEREQQVLLDCLKQVVAMMGATDLEASPVLTTEVDVRPTGRGKK